MIESILSIMSRIQLDKLLHFHWSGISIDVILLLFLSAYWLFPSLPILPFYLQCALAMAVVIAGAWLKDYWYDKRHPDTHTVDARDVWASVAGGLSRIVPYLILMTWAKG